MKKANLIIGIVAIIASVVIICISATYPKAAAYGTGAPGPGLWPICVCVIIILMSILLILKSLKQKQEEDEVIDLTKINQIRVYLAMAVLLLYFCLLKPIGFLLPTFLMVSFFIYWFSKEEDETFVAEKAKTAFGRKVFAVLNISDGYRQSRSIWICLLISLIVTLSVYFIFKLGLKVPMNFGILYI